MISESLRTRVTPDHIRMMCMVVLVGQQNESRLVESKGVRLYSDLGGQVAIPPNFEMVGN